MTQDKMTQEQRDEIDRLIRIFINGMMSPNNDAGWAGESMLSRLIEFEGQLPPPSGYDQSNLSMILAIEKMREGHHDYPRIRSAMSFVIRHNKDQADAIWAKSFYSGICKTTDRTYRDEDRGRITGQGLHSYRYNLKKAYYTVQQELDRIESFMVAMCA